MEGSSPGNAAVDGGKEARAERRMRVLKGATIVPGGQGANVPCVIRNMSRTGAMFELSPDIAVPAAFLLYVPTDGVAYRCELRWRSDKRCGVMFTGTEPKPRGLYG